MIKLKIHNRKLQPLQTKPTPITVIITRVFRSNYIIEFIQSNQKKTEITERKKKAQNPISMFGF